MKKVTLITRNANNANYLVKRGLFGSLKTPCAHSLVEANHTKKSCSDPLSDKEVNEKSQPGNSDFKRATKSIFTEEDIKKLEKAGRELVEHHETHSPY